MNPDVHPAAATGFDRLADAYDRGRPGYPSAVVVYLTDVLRLAPGTTVVDLAAGTGRFTHLMMSTGARVIAIEPVAGMREVLGRSLPSVRSLDGTAEATGLASGEADAVVVAQAFHWFDGQRAVEELARVLRPGGRLGIVFNVRDERDQLQAALERIWEPYRGDTPTHREGAWRAAFGGVGPFTPLVHRSFANLQRLTPEGMVDRVMSVSFIAILPEAERDAVAEQVRNLVRGRDELSLPYRTDVFWTERVSAHPAPSPASGSSSPG